MRRVARAGRRIQWLMAGWLTLVWWALWGTWSAMSLVGGLVVATLALTLFPLPALKLDVSVRPLAVVALVLRFLLDVVVASVQVAVTVLRPPRDLRNAIVRVQLRSDSELTLVIVAELVSLVPGSIVVEANRASHTLYLHVLDVRGPDALDAQRRRVLAQEARVLKALPPRRSPEPDPETDTDTEPDPETEVAR
ncbi:Na+/H+ antiporter subunit E [Nocardioides marinquilinus]|uniref:Na+/H+ antiporter subunit E n=1 Tax=Nocardioides marinquilinus TaxID=1210400 RepID=A0ABP9Q110_9ACTN